MAHRQLRTRLGRSSRPAQPVCVAEPEAAERLSGALRSHADRYRSDAAIDFTLLDALVRMDELEAAADTLEAHRESLQALARDLQDVVADAAVQRDTAAFSVRTGSPLGIRRRLMAATSAAAVLLTLVLPAGRTLPRTILAAVEGRFDNQPDAAPAPADTVPSVRTQPRRPRASAPASTEQRRGPGNAVARDTVRAILAADVAGGSAAADQPESAPVISLEAARAARRQVRSQAQAPEAPQDELPPVPPRPAEEQQSDAEVVELGIELDEPDLP